MDRFDMEAVSLWLTGHQDYQWLSIDQPDLDHVVFKCLVTELTPVSVPGYAIGFEATVECDCPYAYSHKFEYTYEILGTTDISVRNSGSVREYLKPDVRFTPLSSSEGDTILNIVNKSDNDRTFSVRVPHDTVVNVDNNNGIIQDLTGGTNLYRDFNWKFFRLVPGYNDIVVTGDGTLTISGRFLHNVAG